MVLNRQTAESSLYYLTLCILIDLKYLVKRSLARLLYRRLHGRYLSSHHPLRHLILGHQATEHDVLVFIGYSPASMTVGAFHYRLIPHIHGGDEIERELPFGFVHAKHALLLALRARVHDESLGLNVIACADDW